MSTELYTDAYVFCDDCNKSDTIKISLFALPSKSDNYSDFYKNRLALINLSKFKVVWGFWFDYDNNIIADQKRAYHTCVERFMDPLTLCPECIEKRIIAHKKKLLLT